MSDNHVRRSGDDYAKALLALLPQGMAWPRSSGSVLVKTVNGLSQIWGYVDGKAADLLEIETDPRATTEMIDEWERAFGLPDECIPFPPTVLADRRAALLTRMTLLGAQSREFFESQATALGYTVEIQEYAPYMCGVSRCGDTRSPLYGSDVTHFRWQLGPAEIRLYWTVTLDSVLTGIECVFRRYKPAHTEIVFKYGTSLEREISTYYWLGF